MKPVWIVDEVARSIAWPGVREALTRELHTHRLFNRAESVSALDVEAP